MNKRFLIVNCLAGLLIGTLFYCLYDNTTIVTSVIYSLLDIDKAILCVGNSFLYYIRIYGLDLIWAYSMWFGVAVASFGFSKRVLISSLTTIVSGICIEMFQLFRLSSGTADLYDVFIEVLGVIIAIIVYKIKEREDLCK